MALLAAWVDVFANIAQIFLLVLGMFLILVVLLQRGRGGGLAGAFGGAGGQSAFGTKAGDVFTKITIGIAVLWVITNGVSGMLIRASQSAISESQLPGGDEGDGETVTGSDDESDVPLADELDGSEATGAGTTGTPEDDELEEGMPDSEAIDGADANAPESQETPETGADPADTDEAAIDTPDTDEAAAPETGDDATEDADAEEATESDVPSTDTVEENATPPESPDEAAESTTDGGDDAAVPPN